MLSDGNRVLLRFFSAPYASASPFDTSQGLPLYPAWMRMRMREVADLLPPSARRHFIVRSLISLALPLGLIIVAFAVFLIVVVMDDVEKAMRIERMGYGMIGFGVLCALAFWLAFHPLFVAAGRSTQRKFNLDPFVAQPGDEKIVARIYINHLIVMGAALLIFGGVGIGVLTRM